jgi:hypothetical protein
MEYLRILQPDASFANESSFFKSIINIEKSGGEQASRQEDYQALKAKNE